LAAGDADRHLVTERDFFEPGHCELHSTFPSYPSAHAGLGSALFQTLRHFNGTDNSAFSFTSDEFKGVTHDLNGATRPILIPGLPQVFAHTAAIKSLR